MAGRSPNTQAPPGGGAFYSFGTRIYRARRLVLMLWGLLLLGSLPLAPRIGGLLQAGGLSSEDLESARASAELQRQLGYNPATVIVVFTSAELSVDDPRWDASETAA